MMKNKFLSSLLSALLIAATGVPYATVDAASAVVRLGVQFPDRVGVGSLQTVSINLLDQNGQTVSDATDEVAVKMGSHQGLVRVFDNQGHQLTADSNGQFLLAASNGVATYDISDTMAETVSYAFTDASDTSVRGTSTLGFFSVVSKYFFNQSPIAITGTLDATTTTHVTLTAADKYGQGISTSKVFLSFSQADGGGSASVGGQALSDTPTAFTADRYGHITIDYTTPDGLPNGSTDKIIAEDDGNFPNKTATTSYTFGSIAKISGATTTIAPTGSIKAAGSVQYVITARTSKNITMSKSSVFLSMKDSGTGATASADGKPITDSPAPFVTDDQGRISITYTAPDPLPNGGVDTIVAQDTDGTTTPKVKSSFTYTYAKMSRFVMVPSSIAAIGSLKVNQPTQFAMTIRDSSNNPMPKTAVYLTLSQAPGSDSSAIANGTTLSDQPTQVYTDGIGQVVVQYTAPSVLPNGGTDKIVAVDDPDHPKITGSNSYTFASVAKYNMFYSPIAASGTLNAGDTKTVTVTALDNKNKPIANTRVYLSLTNPAGVVGSANVSAQGPVTSDVQEFETNDQGQVDIDYKVPTELPSGSTDMITAQDAIEKPHLKTTDAYTYKSIARFVPSSPSIAPTGTLNPSEPTQVAFTAVDSTGKSLPNTDVYLSYSQVPGGGVAKINGVALTKELMKVKTDAYGQVLIDYTAPSAFPSGGSDTVSIQDVMNAPHAKGTVSYTFPQISKFLVNANPIATKGTLAAGTPVTIHVKAVDSHGYAIPNAQVFLAFTQAVGGGSAVVDNQPGQPLGIGFQAFQTGPDGTISITYTAPGSLPNGGTDTILIQDLQQTPHAAANDKYTFANL